MEGTERPCGGEAGGDGGCLTSNGSSGDGRGCGYRFLATPALFTRRSMYPFWAFMTSTMSSRLSRSVIFPSTGMILSNFYQIGSRLACIFTINRAGGFKRSGK